MSSPATPLAPDPADAVPPVERERYWWTPLALALDRWLQPRWRALLTWVVLAALSTSVMLSERFAHALNGGVEFILDQLLTHMPSGSPWQPTSYVSVFVATAVFVQCWWQPLILRLGLLRWCIWVGTAILMTVPFTVADGAVMWFWGVLGGVPGLAMAGRRTRPWMSIIAAGVASPLVLVDPLIGIWLASSLNGAVMLYGTSPLPRKEEAP